MIKIKEIYYVYLLNPIFISLIFKSLYDISIILFFHYNILMYDFFSLLNPVMNL